jgi:centriolar protein POC1
VADWWGGWAGDVVVSGGDDKTVRIWDLNQRQCVHTFYDHTGPVNDVTFHPDGLCVAACSADNTIKIWDMRMHQLLQVSFLYHSLY